MLKSRFRFHGDYIGALFLTFFAIFVLIKLIFDPYDTKGRELGIVFMCFVVLMWFVLGYVVYSILKIPRILLSDDFIILKTVFSSRQISWKEIDAIQLTGKRSSSFWRNAEEVSTLILKTGEKVFIRIECYKNSPEIRQVFEKVNISILENKPVRIESISLLNHEVGNIPQPDIWEEDLIKYSGIPYLNFKALVFYGFSIGLIASTISTIELHPERLPILFIPIIAFYLGFGFQLHYFLLSNKRLIIKNAFWFWKKHIYRVDELLEVVFETPDKMSNSVRIITKNFKSKLYPAGGLQMKHWKELKTRLESLGVKTRDEIGI